MYKASASQKITSVLLYKKPLAVYNFLRSALQLSAMGTNLSGSPPLSCLTIPILLCLLVYRLYARSISLTSQYANNKINFDKRNKICNGF